MAAPYPTEPQPAYGNDTYPYAADPNGYANHPDAYQQEEELAYPNPALDRTDSSFSTTSSLEKKKKRMMPRPPHRQARAILEKAPDTQTEYMGMLLHMSTVIEFRPYWNICAAGCTWLMLAGFIVLPGTYTNFKNSDAVKAAEEGPDNIGNRFLIGIANIGLLIVAAILTGIGVLGVFGLWLKWRQNYIWMINKLILPALLNSIMGLLSTLVNVLSKPQIVFNTSALVTTAITGGLVVNFTGMFLWYNNYLLEAVKADHRKAYGDQDVKETIQQANNGQVVV